MSITKLLLLTSCGIVLSGCAHANSIHRLNGIRKTGQIEFVDAKQRAVLVNPVHTYTNVHVGNGNTKRVRDNTTYRICSEPAPDVFSVYALALTGSLSSNLGAGVDPSKQLEALATMSSGEAGSTIERTQTINLMRESMFRTCERYMSGAIDKDTMQIQAARDQRAMVAVLAIEQLTGVVKRKATTLSATAQAELAQANSKLAEEYVKDKKALETAQDSFAKAEEAHKKAAGDYETMNKPDPGKQGGHCEVLAAVPETEVAKPEEEGGSEDKKVTTETETVTKPNPVTGVTTVEEKKTVLEETTSPSVDDQLAGEANSATLEQCNAAKASADSKKTEMESAKSSLDGAKSRFEVTSKLLVNIGKTLQSTGTSTEFSGDEGTNPYSKDRISSVATVVENITRMAFSDRTEMVYICQGLLKVALKNGSAVYPGYQNEVVKRCLSLIEIEAQTTRDQYKLNKPQSAVSILMKQTGLSESDVISVIYNENVREKKAEKEINAIMKCLKDNSKTSKFDDPVKNYLKKLRLKTLPITMGDDVSNLMFRIRNSDDERESLNNACK